MVVELRSYVAGNWRDGTRWVDDVNPAQPDETVARTSLGDARLAAEAVETARAASLEVVHVESLRPHYAHTLDCWAANLKAKETRAIELAGEEMYRTYMKYLTGCADLFRSGETNLYQFKMRVA